MITSCASNVPLHHDFLSFRIGTKSRIAPRLEVNKATFRCITSFYLSVSGLCTVLPPVWKSRKQRSVASRLSISPYRDYALYRSRLEVKKATFRCITSFYLSVSGLKVVLPPVWKSRNSVSCQGAGAEALAKTELQKAKRCFA